MIFVNKEAKYDLFKFLCEDNLHRLGWRRSMSAISEVYNTFLGYEGFLEYFEDFSKQTYSNTQTKGLIPEFYKRLRYMNE